MSPNDPNQPSSDFPPPSSVPPQAPPARTQISLPSVDFKSLTKGQWLIAGGAIVFLIASFIPWYGASYNGFGLSISSNVNAWWHWTGIIAGLVSIVVLAFFALRLLKVQLPALPVADKLIFMAGGGLVLVLTALYWIIVASSTGGLRGFSAVGFSVGPAFGLFLGLLAAIAMIAGGFLIEQA